MKKVTATKKVSQPVVPMWVVLVSAVVLAFLVYSVSKSRDSRSSADDSAGAGIVLPVASDKE